MDWSSASDAVRTSECGDGVQWPNDRKPSVFIVYLQRFAAVFLLRHLLWQCSHDLLTASLCSLILSWSLAWASLYACIAASRTSCTNFAQSGSLIGAGTPFEQTRPGTISRLADSASASDAFSTACQPPN